MPLFNLTIDDTSPLIQYAPTGVWSDSSHADSLWQSYSNGTFHATNHSDATATLTFNGSAVYLYGAFRGNHDVYWVTLDGTTTVRNGNANGGPEAFQQLMFSATGLGKDQHQLVLQNKYTTASPSWVDVDYILVTSGDGDPTTPSIDTVLDDGDPSITYSHNQWSDSPNSLITNYYNNTYHLTNQPGATATISFRGNAITVYGATSGNHGTFTVGLDGGVSTAFSGEASAFRPQNMLYYAGGLSNNSHTLTITNIDTTGKFFDLDKVVVSNWIVKNTTGNTNTSSTGTDQPQHTSSGSKTNVGAIVGGVVGGIAFLVLVLLALFFFIRRRRHRAAESAQPNPEAGAATQAQARRNNFSSSQEPMMVEPFIASQTIPVPHATGASTIPTTTTSSSNLTSPWRPVGSHDGGTTETSSVIDLTAPSLPPLKQDTYGYTRPPTHVPSNSESTSANFSEPRTRPSLSMFGGSTTDDLPPPNYAEATGSSRDNSSAGR